jgi:hypothetical protein
MVIRNIKSVKGEKDYKLTIGDVLKFGRVKLRVADIVHEDLKCKDNLFENERHDMLITKSEKQTMQENVTKNFTIMQTSHIKVPSKILSSSRNTLSGKMTVVEETKRKKVCRICLEENDQNDVGPNSIMLSPCKCSGTSKYIHFICLQTWLKNKAVLNYLITTNCHYYEIKSIECEICKSIFPGKVFLI